MSERPVYLTQDQLAQRLGVSVWALTKWRRQGGTYTPEFIKVGRSVLYAEHKVDEWLLTTRARTSSAQHWQLQQEAKAAAEARAELQDSQA